LTLTSVGEQPLQLVDSRIDLNGQILIAKASQLVILNYST
jgi:hypothetical protein